MLDESPGKLLTTDYIIDELLTLMSVRGHRTTALDVGPAFWSGLPARLHWITQEDASEAWAVFVRHNDKRWSFTDCTSYAVMQRLGINEAFSLDEHFRQFGFATMKP